MDQKMLPGSVTRRDLLRAAAFVPAGLYAAQVSIAGTADAAALHAFDQHRDHVSRAEARRPIASAPWPRKGSKPTASGARARTIARRWCRRRRKRV